MNKGLVAKSSIAINAPVAAVWDALVTPEKLKQFFFGVDTITDWKESSSIIWKGEWQGKSFEDKGTILRNEKNQLLQYTHFSPLSGKPDAPENYHTVTINLSRDDNQTIVTLSQDNNATDEERKHSEKNWKMVLEGLKKMLEE